MSRIDRNQAAQATSEALVASQEQRVHQQAHHAALYRGKTLFAYSRDVTRLVSGHSLRAKKMIDRLASRPAQPGVRLPRASPSHARVKGPAQGHDGRRGNHHDDDQNDQNKKGRNQGGKNKDDGRRGSNGQHRQSGQDRQQGRPDGNQTGAKRRPGIKFEALIETSAATTGEAAWNAWSQASLAIRDMVWSNPYAKVNRLVWKNSIGLLSSGALPQAGLSAFLEQANASPRNPAQIARAVARRQAPRPNGDLLPGESIMAILPLLAVATGRQYTATQRRRARAALESLHKAHTEFRIDNIAGCQTSTSGVLAAKGDQRLA
jgi:hypothetical protein